MEITSVLNGITTFLSNLGLLGVLGIGVIIAGAGAVFLYFTRTRR